MYNVRSILASLAACIGADVVLPLSTYGQELVNEQEVAERLDK